MGWSVVGVDWSSHAVALANEAAARRGLDARFLAADTTTWRPAKPFDLVLSTYVLLGGGDANARILQTALGALKPGGTLLVVEWDVSMAEVWHFDADELLSVEQIVSLLPDLTIETVEVRHFPEMFDADDPRAHAGRDANVAVVRAGAICVKNPAPAN